MGFDEHTKGYRIYDPNKNIIFKSRNVSFINENNSAADTPTMTVKPKHSIISMDLNQLDATYCESEMPNVTNNTNATTNHINEMSQLQEHVEPPLLRRSARNRQGPVNLNDFVTDTESTYSFDDNESANLPNEADLRANDNSTSEAESEFYGFSGLAAPPSYQNRPVLIQNQQLFKLCDEGRISKDPATLEEALSRPDANEWKLAMEEEYQSLIENGTWSLSELPPNRKAIKSKWVFRTKRDITGCIDRYKARLVIKGYSQRERVDYEETYSPVVRHSSLRYIFAIATQLNLKVEQMDVVTAFLQAALMKRSTWNSHLFTQIKIIYPKLFVSTKHYTGSSNRVEFGIRS